MDEHLIDDRDKPSADWTRPGEPPIHWAARKGDQALLTRLIGEGVDINQRADLEHDNGPHLTGLTPLMIAARSIDGATVDTLRWLVENGADYRATSEGGNTAAWYAAGHGARWGFHKKAVTPDHAERLEYLLGLGLDPTERNFIGRSLLTEACEAGDAARVRVLLDRGAVVEPSELGDVPEVTRAKLLDEHGIRGKFEVPRGELDSFQIPLFCAARSGSDSCVRLVLDSGANPQTRDSSGSTPLMSAGSAAVVRTLLDHGAEIDAINAFGKDALESVLEESFESGADGPERFEVTEALVKGGADLERVDEFGKTRLSSAAFGHHADGVELLLRLGAKTDRLDTDGTTPLHSICWQGAYQDGDANVTCEAIIRSLVSAGVPVDAKSKHGDTAMHEAASGDWGNPTAIQTLLDLGAAADPTNKNRDTPLLLAAGMGEAACIELLLQAGADPLKRNKQRETPLDAALSILETWKEIDEDGLAETVKAARDQIERDEGDLTETQDEIFSSLPGEDQRAINRAALEKAQRAVELLRSAIARRDPKRG